MKISGKIVDIHQKRLYPGEISISENRIVEINEVTTASNVYIMPGLIDAHVHIESSMLTPAHFAIAVVRHGTTGVISDPHEIANVLGIKGVKYMIKNAEKVPVKIMFGAPSCVPATPFESTGAKIGAEEIEELIKMEKIGFLAEMMNFPGVIYDDAEVHQKLKLAKNAGIPIDGHAPGLSGEGLKKYINSGISTDHECTSLEEALEKISGGMKILIREGSAAKNLEVLAPLINLYPSEIMLCTDDLHPETLSQGHINRLIARLIGMGYNMFDVIRAATINVIRHYGIKAGALREGDPADLIIVDDPQKMNVIQTWIDGRMVFDGQKAAFPPGEVEKINKFNCTRILPDDIRVMNRGEIMRVINARNGELLTGTGTASTGSETYVRSRPEEDILKIVLKERYNDAPPAVGFIRGFGFKSGAIATSVAHDSHNLIAIGVKDRDIVRALNMIIDAEGGMSVVSENEEQILKLPVAGIMSDIPITVTASRYERLTEAAKDLGCRMDAPFMTLSFMALLVIPELKISDRGLFDGIEFKHVPLFI